MLPKHEEKLNQIHQSVLKLGSDIINIHKSVLEGFKANNISTFEEIKEMIKDLPSKANEIDNEVVKVLALFEPEAKDLRTIVAILKITNELSRILIVGKNYAKIMKNELNNSEFDFSALKDYIIQLHTAAINSIIFSIDLLSKDGEEFDDLYRKVMIEESKTDDLLSLIEKEILTKLSKGNDFLVEYIGLLNSVRRLEKVADHSVNIAKLIHFAKKGGKIESF